MAQNILIKNIKATKLATSLGILDKLKKISRRFMVFLKVYQVDGTEIVKSILLLTVKEHQPFVIFST